VVPPGEHADPNTHRRNHDQGRQVTTADLAETGDRCPEVNDVQDERAQDRVPDDERGKGEKTGAQQAVSSHALVPPRSARLAGTWPLLKPAT